MQGAVGFEVRRRRTHCRVLVEAEVLVGVATRRHVHIDERVRGDADAELRDALAPEGGRVVAVEAAVEGDDIVHGARVEAGLVVHVGEARIAVVGVVAPACGKRRDSGVEKQ